MSDATQIWALYEQTAAQPPQYQPTANDKKASQLNAAAQKPQTPAQVTQTQPAAPMQKNQTIVSQQQQPQEEQETDDVDSPEIVDAQQTIAAPQTAKQISMPDKFNTVVDYLRQQVIK